VGVVASLLLFAALSPLLVDLVLSIPLGIVGGLWLILGAFVIIAGVQMLASRILDVRKSLVIGLSIPIGMSAAIYPEVFAVFPEFLQPLTNSTLALGTTTAMFLNAIFRIGIKQSAEISIARTDDPGTRIEAFLRRQGGLWAARSFVIDKAIFSLAQVVELIHDCRGDSDDIRVLAEFDEYNLRLSITHSGEPLDFPRRRPTLLNVIEN
jgi:NCS2 family nucleobase:cation symporter-2